MNGMVRIMGGAGTVMLCALMLGACGPSENSPTPPKPLGVDETARTSATLSTNCIRIGDPVELTLTALHRTNAAVAFPELAKGKAVIVRDRVRTEEAGPEGTVLTQERLQLTSLTVTNHVLGDQTDILVTTPEGVFTQSMPFVTLEVVTSLAPGETELRPMDWTPAHWPAPPSRWVLWAGLALVVLAALTALAWAAARHPGLVRAPVIPEAPAHETALTALAELRGRDWIARGLVEPFFVELSGIVRRYVEGRFGLRAPERTTEEFIHDAMHAPGWSSSQRTLLAGFLEQCDLVKFARHVPGGGEMVRALDAAEGFVRETMPPPGAEQDAMSAAAVPMPEGGAA